MIGVIDYGMGNLLSVLSALEHIGARVKICHDPKELAALDRIVLPGVGAFKNCQENLRNSGFWDALHEAVIQQRKPILGICLGMQIMAKKSYEEGEYSGLGWIDAEVIRINPSAKQCRVPHVGWNEITYEAACPLFKGLPKQPEFYFVHSYYLKCANSACVSAVTDHGGQLTAAICQDNIMATQFHPEKSQDYGLKLLENFLEWKP